MSEEADENSRDGSCIGGGVPAIFVPSSQKALCADEIIPRLRKNQNMSAPQENQAEKNLIMCHMFDDIPSD